MKLFPGSSINKAPDVAPRTEDSDGSSELGRIMALPRRKPLDCERRQIHGKLVYSAATQALIEVMTERFAIKREPRADGSPSCACHLLGHPCITELNAEQAWILREMSVSGGVLGFIPVGGGKTLAGILAPLAIPNIKVAVLLIKSDQRLHYRKSWERLREHFRVPTMTMDDGGEPLIVSGAPIAHVIPYSKLSRPESTKLLTDLNPDVIIADEVHCLADMTSARTLRWLRFMASRSRLHFAGWSGSLLDKTIRSVAHISAHALGTCSPFPINPSNVEAWSNVIDPGNKPDRDSSISRSIFKAFGGASFDRVVDTEDDLLARELALTSTIKVVRKGFQARLAETPGVITSHSSSSTASIVMYPRQVIMPDKVRDAVMLVRKWVRPDGEELAEAIDQARCVREVASGFYYHWIFPNGEPEDLIHEWFAKRKAFNKELRERILKGQEFLDSRNLCENAAMRAWQTPSYEGELPVWHSLCWPAWSAIENKVVHKQKATWIDDYLAADAAQWAKEHKGIVWTMSNTFGRRVAELAGINYHGGGEGAEKRILAETGERSIVASQKAHSEGRDGLQFRFSEQLVAEAPAGGKAWGQMLGRLCRRGQKADTINTWTYVHFSEAKDAIRQALRQSEYVEDMTPTESLLSAVDFTFDL